MAFPRPVPPPVMNTHTPARVPAGRAAAPTGGGKGRPGISAAPVDGWPVIGLGGAHLGEVLALVDERLVDQLVGHRRLLLRTGQVADPPPGHLHGDRWRGG